MKRTLKYFAMCVVVFSVAFIGCKKKVQPGLSSVKNPCDCAKEVSASFKVGDYYGDEFIEEDTIVIPVLYGNGNPSTFDYLNYAQPTFIADIAGAISYTWQVGNNSITQNVRKFSLYFQDTIGTIPVTLIVQAKPNLKCFPNDDGKDTLTKYITIRNVTPIPMVGKYYGANTDDPTNFFTVEIDTFTRYANYYTGGRECAVRLKNLPNGNLHRPQIGPNGYGAYPYSFMGVADEEQPPFNNPSFLCNDISVNPQKITRGILNRSTNRITINYFTKSVITPFQWGAISAERTFIGIKTQ